MVVLDTTFLIHFLKKKQNAIMKAKLLPKDAATTRINVFEILVGIYLKKSEERETALKIFYDFLDSITVLELDAKSTDEAARISAELRQKGETVTEADVLIAAIALVNGKKTIVTENTAHFSKIPGIIVEGY